MEVPAVLSAQAQAERARSNRRLAVRLGVVALFFVGFGFALVPLYDVICSLTGFNGRTNAMAAPANPNTQVDTTRWVTVEFLSHTMPGVGIELAPETFSMKVHPGAIVHTHYMARNGTSQAFSGQAVPSVTPAVAAPYFQKIECFCFSPQTFAPGEERAMPVVFVVKPDLSRDMSTITLSYTFFETPRAKV